jgi:hypothetical protein
MNLTINNYDINTKRQNFTGALDGVVTGALRTLDTNEMANAVLIDLGAMVAPRTYYDAKNRNKYAGFETFFREISGTFINCLSAGLLAFGISHLITNRIMPEVKIPANSWFSEEAINTLHQAWKTSENNTSKYVQNIFNNLSGIDGKRVNKFAEIDFQNVVWHDEKSWANIAWNNPKYKTVVNNLKTKDGVIQTMTDLITDKNLHKKDRNNLLKIMEARITNALGANRDLKVDIEGKTWNEGLKNILRDTYNMGKNVFTNDDINIEQALKKIKKINKIKIFGALSGAALLGLTNQAINRKITEKRTGKKGFVGDVDYVQKNKETNTTKKSKALLFKKLLSSAGMIAMVIGVMKVKNPKDFVRKLQFTGPVTSGNAIKTVYATNIVGRFMAADNDTELRESVTRDYFGFLNWLVFGGFASKGVANLLDKNRTNLFNIKKEGKGLKHWLGDISLKTHDEIVAKGGALAQKNLRKLNIAHVSGLLYSAITLGYLLPMINDKLTKSRAKKKVA